MAFLIGLLTVVMVLDCIILILLVLVQLPKKDAGAGLAFGGAATDALFGAGSGTVLTKITKYAAIVLFVLAIVLAVLRNNYHRRSASEFEKRLGQPAPVTAPAVGTPATPAPAVTPPGSVTSTAAVPQAEVPAIITNVPAPGTAPNPPAGTNPASPAPQ
jgi:preprotein translocase subunit SecG